jgi:hypothetical protein
MQNYKKSLPSGKLFNINIQQTDYSSSSRNISTVAEKMEFVFLNIISVLAG